MRDWQLWQPGGVAGVVPGLYNICVIGKLRRFTKKAYNRYVIGGDNNCRGALQAPCISYMPYLPSVIPPKKYTQPIFDDLETSTDGGSFGFLSLMFQVLKDLTLIREEKRWSQNDLAKQSGIAQPTIARIESGRANPTLYQLIRLTKALGVRITFEPVEYPDGDYEGYLE